MSAAAAPADSLEDAEQPLLQSAGAPADSSGGDAAAGSAASSSDAALPDERRRQEAQQEALIPAGRAEGVGRAASSALLVALLVGVAEGGLLLAAR